MSLADDRSNFLNQVKEKISKRELSFDDLDLVSRVQEVREQDATFLRNIEETLSTNQVDDVNTALANRYTGFSNVEQVHSEAGYKTHHTRLKSNGLSLRVKSACKPLQLVEIDKNTHFSAWLSGKKELGYLATRDVGHFYLVMLQGVPFDKALQLREDWRADQIIESLVDFIGEYYFGHIISGSNVKPGQAKYNFRLYAQATMQQASRLSNDAERIQKEISEFSDNVAAKLSDTESVTYTAPDSKLSNLIIFPNDETNVKSKNLFMIDRGWKAAVRDSMPPEEFECYLGLPFFDLGVLYQTLLQSHDYDTVRKSFEDRIRHLRDTGKWETNKREYETAWRPELIDAAFEFGRLYPVIRDMVKAEERFGSDYPAIASKLK